MRWGYHAGVLSDHDPIDAVRELHAIGYATVAVRTHPAWLHPLRPDFSFLQRLEKAAAGGTLVVDGDAPFLLDARAVGEPPLLNGPAGPDARRLELACATLRMAASVGASLVTLTTGPKPPSQADEAVLDQLADVCRVLTDQSREVGTEIAIRPSIGGFVESIAHFERIGQWLTGSAARLRLAADVGVMAARGELPAVPLLGRNPASLACVYLPIGDATEEHAVDPQVVATGLRDIGYQGDLILIETSPAQRTLEAAEAAYSRYIHG